MMITLYSGPGCLCSVHCLWEFFVNQQLTSTHQPTTESHHKNKQTKKKMKCNIKPCTVKATTVSMAKSLVSSQGHVTSRLIMWFNYRSLSCAFILPILRFACWSACAVLLCRAPALVALIQQFDVKCSDLRYWVRHSFWKPQAFVQCEDMLYFPPQYYPLTKNFITVFSLMLLSVF